MKLYQNLPGFEAVDPNRKNSKYWNEGKWNHFIKPLLPKDPTDMTLVEMGANAGLFLKLAKDYGFSDVLGIEKDKITVEEGIKYKDVIGYDYKLLNQTVGANYNLDEIPVADVTLLSNFHYYMTVMDFLEYLDKLRNKTVYCLVVSSDHNSPSHHWRASGMIPDIRNYFKDWEEIEAVYRASSTQRLLNDPSPRRIWSILFKSRLKRVSMDNLHYGAPGSIKEAYICRDELAQLVADGKEFDLTQTKYYQVWKNRYEWTDERVFNFVKERIDNMESVKKDGMKKPIWMYLDNKLIDGGHRVAILKALGYKSIIARIV